MKISIVTPSLAGGGAEKVAVNLANQYAADGYRVDLVVFNTFGPYLKSIETQVNLVDLNSKRTRNSLMPLRRYFKNKLKKDESEIYVISTIRDANIIAAIASIGICGVRIIGREANTLDGLHLKPNVTKILYLYLMRFSYKRLFRVIANSEGTMSDLCRYDIIEKQRIRVIPNPVFNEATITGPYSPPNLPWFDDKNIKVILSVGRLHKQKNLNFLIDVFASLVKTQLNVRLLIIGDGPEESALRRRVSLLNLDGLVKILPFQNSLAPFYNYCVVFALCSNWEGFGNVIVEALSFGMRIVSTDCKGGPREILDGGRYGALVAIGDLPGYLDALEKALEHENDFVGRINHSQRFLSRRVAYEYLALFQ